MTSLLARAALAPLLLTTLACGTAAPPLAPAARTLEGHPRARHLTGAGPVEVADADVLARLTADGYVGDAYWAFTVAPQEGGFAVQDVPEGSTLYLGYAGPRQGEPLTPDNPYRFVVVDADAGLEGALDVRAVLGRPGAPACGERVWGALQLAGAGIFQEASYHLVSTDVGMASTFEQSQPLESPLLPLPGAWALQGERRRCPRAEDGDRALLLSSLEQRSVEGRHWSVTAGSAPLAVTFSAARFTEPQTLQTTLAQLPAQPLTVEREGFLAPLSAAGVRLGVTEPQWRLAVHAAHAPEGVVGPLLLLVEGQRPVAPPPLDVQPVRLLDARWEALVSLSAAGPFGEAGRRVLRSRLEAGPVLATLSPPELLTSNAGPRGARLAWQPPLLGVPTWYAVSLRQDLGQDRPLRAHFLTRDTSLRLPPQLLPPGIYVVTVTAYAPERAPADLGARSQALWAEGAWASTAPLSLLLK